MGPTYSRKMYRTRTAPHRDTGVGRRPTEMEQNWARDKGKLKTGGLWKTQYGGEQGGGARGQLRGHTGLKDRALSRKLLEREPDDSRKGSERKAKRPVITTTRSNRAGMAATPEGREGRPMRRDGSWTCEGGKGLRTERKDTRRNDGGGRWKRGRTKGNSAKRESVRPEERRSAQPNKREGRGTRCGNERYPKRGE